MVTLHSESISTAAAVDPPRAWERARVRGKFLWVGSEKFIVRGVTYGTFAPDASGSEYHRRERLDVDFPRIAAQGFNTIRTYTPPPRWVLDLAQEHGLRILVGLSWEQHVTFLDDPERLRSIALRMEADVARCAGHPAVLAYAVGNEIPPSIARWHGSRAVERCLRHLCEIVRRADPGALVTYVNFPTTEYLELPFIDLLCFNLYLESSRRLTAYIARLQNLAGDRPLLMTEIGLDSRSHGEAAQAAGLEAQVRSVLRAGCAGAIVFAWTDEWHRGGHDIVDWDFGLTRRDRSAKPALAAVREAFHEDPFPPPPELPRFSIVICTYNGSRTLEECLRGVALLDYPNYEVIVVNDGSTDDTGSIIGRHPVRRIDTPNRGLSAARNTGLGAATGDLVAFLDDDAHPDPHWLKHLAAAFKTTLHAGIGGPNIPPEDDGAVAACVANAPGGPIHVLTSDQEAEHLPGCNMAFRKSVLEAVGGFDPQFRVAGDDVDLCWRIQELGWTLGYCPAAMVWHHRRNSVLAYLRQQRGYGRAEALLERKWPDKYNAMGHVKWAGRLYGRGLTRVLGRASRIYHGMFGSAPFQGRLHPAPGLWRLLPAMPEWHFVLGALTLLALLGGLWPKLVYALIPLAAAGGITLWQAAGSVADAAFSGRWQPWPRRLCLKGLTLLLHLLQPVARLAGRVGYGLTPGRSRIEWHPSSPFPHSLQLWSETWKSPESVLRRLEGSISEAGGIVVHGGEFERWDLDVRGGILGRARMLLAVEEHGQGRQLFRIRVWPSFAREGVLAALVLGALAAGAAADGARGAALILGTLGAGVAAATLKQAAAAVGLICHATRRLAEPGPDRTGQMPG